MSDAKQAPLASVPMFSIPVPKMDVNPTGVGPNPVITKEFENYQNAIKKYADELEQRYAKPNLFKVAAGFAKPQLGGFLASLGSASQALGEQVELQRAVAPTVAQMRAEIAKGTLGLTQAQEAAKIGSKASSEGRILSPVEAADIASLTQGPSAAAAAGQNQATAQTNQLAQALSTGTNYSDLVAKFGKAFVDTNIPILLNTIPGLKVPEGMPGTLGGAKLSGVPGGTPAAPAAGGARPPGVPESMVANLPLGPQLTAQAQTVQAMQEDREKLNATLTQQATTAVPIFEVATNLYKAASNPSLSGAFGVFEKGDPLSIIGKALESGSFPSVIANMRQYITQSRLGADEKKRAISDLQVMEGVLADLNTKINNGVINPTDVRTMFESESIPNTRSTQDAFLRGIARIGSDALTRYELKSAFDKALEDPKFNVQTWASSDYFRNVQENAKRRTQALISNPASVQMPRFMQQGLSGAYRTEPKKSSGSTTTTVPKANDWEAEARRRGLIQ